MEVLRIDPHTRTLRRETLAVPSLCGVSANDKFVLTHLGRSECVPPEHYLATALALFPVETHGPFMKCAPYKINQVGAKRWMLWTRDDLDISITPAAGASKFAFADEVLALPGFTINGGNFWRGVGHSARPALVMSNPNCALALLQLPRRRLLFGDLRGNHAFGYADAPRCRKQARYFLEQHTSWRCLQLCF
jgi:hypothetical protein